MDTAAKAGVQRAFAGGIEDIGIRIGSRIAIGGCQKAIHRLAALERVAKNGDVLFGKSGKGMERRVEADGFFDNLARDVCDPERHE